MHKGAHHVHQQLCNELVNYLESQYLGHSEVLLHSCHEQMTTTGTLYSAPYIESSPAYKTEEDGIAHSILPPEIKAFFESLIDGGLGVFRNPFTHQVNALNAAWIGDDLFVSTGTGSGKTECFLWPMLAHLAREAIKAQSWHKRGVRVIIMYPMNALVADQVGRLRRMLGDPAGCFLDAFQAMAGRNSRRPQFGMYTGRTPYAGDMPTRDQDRGLAKSLARLLPHSEDDSYYEQLLRNGKIPAKADLSAFINGIRESNHHTDPMDAELITRFEMQSTCPDILITNYSMLEYMLLRPREDHIWNQTAERLSLHTDERLLFIIDEAHMYRGSSGGEVALLIQRLMARLNIDRDRLQFILTTASMPHGSKEDDDAVSTFACSLTSCMNPGRFTFLFGDQRQEKEFDLIPIPAKILAAVNLSRMDSSDEDRLNELNCFHQMINPGCAHWNTMPEAGQWLYDHLRDYVPFQRLFKACRGKAVSILRLAQDIFPSESNALSAVDVMLAIAPLGHDRLTGNVLFPARMHMLFRGFRGVYCCSNSSCSHSHEGNGIRLGDIFLNDGKLYCPACHSHVYELYTDRRCGALFFHGYVTEAAGTQYLWTRPGAFYKPEQLREMHFYLPMEGDSLAESRRGGASYRRCFLNCLNGYINFNDNGLGKPGYRELWYSNKGQKGRPDMLTFATCPKCRHQFSHAGISSFSTRGNQSFYNIIQTQFQEQPPASPQKEKDECLPNDGRKVLLFSDSRQKAAVLARDMSIYSDEMGVRKLFMIALNNMNSAEVDLEDELTLNDIYGFMVEEAARQKLDLFSNESREAFRRDQQNLQRAAQTAVLHNRKFRPHRSIHTSDAPQEMQEHLLRLFCMNYNTLTDVGLCFVVPESEALFAAIENLREHGINVNENQFIETFSAIARNMLVDQVALGHQIREEWRENVRRKFGNEDFGVMDFDHIPSVVAKILGCNENQSVQQTWMDAMRSFMTPGQDNPRRYFLNLNKLRVLSDPEHTWFRCKRCASVSPYLLKDCCQVCGEKSVAAITDDFRAEAFWRLGILRSIQGEAIRVIDTEEHTAQLGHKDQRADVWAKTEIYEMRFQDMIQDDEKPIDILSSTTTMEVGIDIGSLVAVGLRNMPPMRENYQQRAGRAGRRGSSLSTIVTFAEGGPHDAYYFDKPEPMFQGAPRRPWIDVNSPKLLQRHLNLIMLNHAIRSMGYSLDSLSAIEFYQADNDGIERLLDDCPLDEKLPWLKDERGILLYCRGALLNSLKELREKIALHPDAYGINAAEKQRKSLLDALYEEGIIPTYSFPKDVVSTYIEDEKGNLILQVDRGLDVAINEYAPGRSIVVDKKTYVIGGIYCHTDGRRNPRQTIEYMKDHRYVKELVGCESCKWFGFKEDRTDATCPFCGSKALIDMAPMLRPWGFSPLNGKPMATVSVDPQYSASDTPLYSTLPNDADMTEVLGWTLIRKAELSDQRIILLNKGPGEKGFMVCPDCGAAAAGNENSVLNGIRRPGNGNTYACNHTRPKNVQLGYDFITDMLVLVLSLPRSEVETETLDASAWRRYAGTTLAEALRKAACLLLDIEPGEIQSGYRERTVGNNLFMDIYLYDSLSSGAGYCAQAGRQVQDLLQRTWTLLRDCDCDRACQRCLNNYQNQRIQADLDRHAAMELLQFGQSARLPDLPSMDVQKNLLKPISGLLHDAGIDLVWQEDSSTWQLRQGLITKQVIVYPAMMKMSPAWQNRNTVAITKEALRDAKPHAVNMVKKGMLS